jgi:hypothetical protein
MEKETFKAKRHFVSCNQLLESPLEKVFPLLCPTREYEWIETWKCDLIFSNSGFAELDCIFNTDFSEENKETWVVDRYEKNKCIQFIRCSESRIIRYGITLSENKNGTTVAIWEQTITSLNLEGNKYIENFLDEAFEKRIKALEKMINYYLKTDEMLKNS